MKSRDGKSQREDQRRERVRRKKMKVREKVGKSRNIVLCFSNDERWKVARPCGANHMWKSKCTRHHMFRTIFGSWDVEKMHAVVVRRCAKHISKSKSVNKLTKKLTVSERFWDVKKVYAAVARSTFPSQHAQSTPCSDHFWKLTCRKSARRCGAKHISKSRV